MRLGDMDRLKEVLERNFGHTDGAAVMRQLIDNAPTIDPVHAASGCRCGECKYHGDIGCTHAYYDADGTLRYAAPYMTDQDGCTRGIKAED